MLDFIKLAFTFCTIEVIITNKMIFMYEGQYFPKKYVTPKAELPKLLDFDNYINRLNLSIIYFGRYPNNTDSNTALSLFFTKSLLKRTLLDYRNKLQKSHIENLLKLINAAEYVLSHYIYYNSWYGWLDLEFRVSKLFQYDAPLVYSIGAFNKNRLTDWIFNKQNVNDFLEEIDNAALPKEKYAELIDSNLEGYYIRIGESDFCISRHALNPEPIDVSTVHPCKQDVYCNGLLTSSPSIGYTLSHRLLNMLFRLNVRRCYQESEAVDIARMDQLCAAMYREAVYIARRGFFARDLFLEHIALCATLGYEEFHRHHWFRKASSWMNDVGCIKEYRNFDLNRSALLLEAARNNEEWKSHLLEWRCNMMHSTCDNHPSAILMIVMSHAIRHAAHFMEC